MIAAAVFAVSLLPSPTHEKKVAPAVTLKQQLSEIKEARRAKIDELRPQVIASCTPPKARAFTQLLVMDGRGPEAVDFADGYADRCGEDPIIESWANAPLPGAGRDGESLYVIDFPALELNAKVSPSILDRSSPSCARLFDLPHRAG